MTNKPSFDTEKIFDPEDYLYFYEKVLPPERTAQELDFLINYTNLDTPQNILDIACGHGRHANHLAALGHQVTGIDLTPGFLEIAKSEAARLGVHVNYKLGDMRYLDAVNSFDRIYCLFTAIGYFDDDVNEKVFHNIYRALKDEGVFCFDGHNRDTCMLYFRPSTVIERDGNYLIDQVEFDTLSGRTNSKRTTVRDGKVKSAFFSIRNYNPSELSQLLKKIGFSAVSFYDGWSGQPISGKTKRMVVVAKK